MASGNLRYVTGRWQWRWYGLLGPSDGHWSCWSGGCGEGRIAGRAGETLVLRYPDRGRARHVHQASGCVLSLCGRGRSLLGPSSRRHQRAALSTRCWLQWHRSARQNGERPGQTRQCGAGQSEQGKAGRQGRGYGTRQAVRMRMARPKISAKGQLPPTPRVASRVQR